MPGLLSKVGSTIAGTVGGANEIEDPEERKRFIWQSIANGIGGGDPADFVAKWKEGLRAESMDDMRRQMFEAQMRRSAEESAREKESRANQEAGAVATLQALMGGRGSAAGLPIRSPEAVPKGQAPQAPPMFQAPARMSWTEPSSNWSKQATAAGVDRGPSKDFLAKFPLAEGETGLAPPGPGPTAPAPGPEAAMPPGVEDFISRIARQNLQPGVLAEVLKGLPGKPAEMVYGRLPSPEGSMTEREAWEERRDFEEKLTRMRMEASSNQEVQRQVQRELQRKEKEAKAEAAAQAAANEKDLKETLDQARAAVTWASQDVDDYRNEHQLAFETEKGSQDPVYLEKKANLDAARVVVQRSYENLKRFQKTKPETNDSGVKIVLDRLDKAMARLGLRKP